MASSLVSPPRTGSSGGSGGGREVREDPAAGTLTFGVAHLNDCLHRLASAIAQRERVAYESYAGYYEAQLAQRDGLLYRKEREVEALRDALASQSRNADVEVNCRMADKSFALLLGMRCSQFTLCTYSYNMYTGTFTRTRINVFYSFLSHKSVQVQ